MVCSASTSIGMTFRPYSSTQKWDVLILSIMSALDPILPSESPLVLSLDEKLRS